MAVGACVEFVIQSRQVHAVQFCCVKNCFFCYIALTFNLLHEIYMFLTCFSECMLFCQINMLLCLPSVYYRVIVGVLNVYTISQERSHCVYGTHYA